MKNTSEIETILRDFHKMTGARVSLHDLDFHEITACPSNSTEFCRAVQAVGDNRAICTKMDKSAFLTVKKTGKPHLYRCHCGLVEIVAPIYHFGILAGYFMMGQIAFESNESIREIQRIVKERFPDTPASDKVDQIPRVSEDLLDSYFHIFSVLAGYLTKSNAVRPKQEDLASGIKRYLDENYSDNLSIGRLCEEFSCSKATLINSFKDKYGKTVFSYLKALRLKNAAQELKNTKKAIKEIASECGFIDQNYFSKVFVHTYGVSPTRFRERFAKKE